MLSWHKTPPAIQNAMKFVAMSNEVRAAGVQRDAAEVLAVKLGSRVIREYFARLLNAVQDGELDPMTRDELGNIRELLNGEEEATADDRRPGDDG